MKKKNADAVILAAGLSARFPGFKPLLKIGNRTLIEKTIDSLDNICSNIIIVCGHRADDVINAVKNYSKVVTVINKDYLEGMFGSVIEGVKNVKSDWFFILPADMPFVRERTYISLLEVNADIVIPVFKGKKGHPVLMESKYKQELLNERKVLNFSEFIKLRNFSLLEVDDEGVLIDIDTADDLKNNYF